MTKKFKLHSLKTKLILSFSALILLSSLSIGIIAIQVSSNIIIDEAKKTLVSVATEEAKLVSSRLETQRNTLELLSSLESTQSMDWENQQPILNGILGNSSFLQIGIMQLNGSVSYSDGSTSQFEESHVIRSVLNGETTAISFGINDSTKTLDLIQAVPISKGGKLVGAVVGHQDGTILSEIVADTGFGEQGFGYMTDERGTTIAYPIVDYVFMQMNPIDTAQSDPFFVSLATMVEKAISEKAGTADYYYDGVSYNAGHSKIEGTDWSFVLIAVEDEVLAAIPNLQKTIILISIIVLVICILVTYVIGRSIANPIAEIIEHAKKITNLDLTAIVRQKYLNKKDEVGELAKSLQSLTEGLLEVVYEVKHSTEQLEESSEELTATSQQSSFVAQEMAKTVHEIAEGANEQAKSTEEGSAKVALLGDAIQKVDVLISNVNKSSVKVGEIVEEGQVEMDSLNRVTEESALTIEEIYQVVVKANESSNKIGEASNLIESISSQTNLLSLNAAIEAARAGEAGKGFAVVADEIRKLAEQSSNSTKVINDIVSELQSNTHNSVQSMNRVMEISKEQSTIVKNSRRKYEMIEESMLDSIETIQGLSASGEEMNQMRNEILEIIETLSAIAEGNAASTEEASASMEEQAASIEEIAVSTDRLSESAQNLHQVVKKFEL